MPVDLFTPTVLALAAVILPIFTALRGTPGSFATGPAIELALACWLYVRFLAHLNPKSNGAFLALCRLLYAVPQIVGLTVLAHRRQTNPPANPRCPTCGHGLRATLNRCPECGHAPPTTR
jgi:hypothetical protein